MRSIVTAFCCLLLLVGAAFAQSDRGTITGTIADPAGASVSNASIEAKNTATGAVYPALSTTTGNYTITVPESPDIDPDTNKIMMRSAEVDLMSALELGEIDYLFIYRSVAYQHRDAGVSFMEFREEIDLSSVAQADFYGRVKLVQASGNEVKAKPIVYGITIPATVKNREMAEDFIELLLSSTGQEIFNKKGQPPIVPAVASDTDMLPEKLKNMLQPD